jgi:hypothetical protein
VTEAVLDASRSSDAATWRDLVLSLPEHLRDLHYLPAYVKAYADEWGAQAKCGVINGSNGFVIYPHVRRSADHLCSPYGYGAPLASEPVAEDVVWRGITSAPTIWFRMHPLLSANHQPAGKREKQVVWMDLTADNIESGLRKGHRSSVAAARRAGVTIGTLTLGEFYQMYLATMERLTAEDRWRFSIKLLRDLRDAFPDGFTILAAFYNGQPEAACVLLRAFGTCYYHYAASWRRHPEIGAGNLLVVEAARWAKSQRDKRLHLGGGLTPDPNDSLLRFKSGFSTRRAWTYTS